MGNYQTHCDVNYVTVECNLPCLHITAVITTLGRGRCIQSI